MWEGLIQSVETFREKTEVLFAEIWTKYELEFIIMSIKIGPLVVTNIPH